MEIPAAVRALKIDRVMTGNEARLMETPVPDVRPGWPLVKVEAFGLNNSERLVRI